MSAKQNHPVTPPSPDDKSFVDFSGAIQRNLSDLFDASHSHTVKAALPIKTDGKPQDMVTVDDGTNVYIAVRTSRGWFKTAALTAL